jgi:hypothetical protein
MTGAQNPVNRSDSDLGRVFWLFSRESIMTDSVMWIIPEAPAPTPAPASMERSASAVLRFGVLDNSKSNADHLLAMIIEGVQAKYPQAAIVRARKPGPAIGATAEVLAELARETDVVIAAMAD